MSDTGDAISCNLGCMCHPKYIKIYKGYGTYYNGHHLVHIGIDGIYTEQQRKYKFVIGGITKEYENITDGFFVDLTADETATLNLGPINGTIIAVDDEENETPMTTAIPFIVENWVQGDIDVEQVELTINVKDGDTNEFTIKLNSPYFATVLHNDLQQRDAQNCHPVSSITGLQEALNQKQDVIEDLDGIRNGASLGATSLQPSALNNTSLTGNTTAQNISVGGYNVLTTNSPLDGGKLNNGTVSKTKLSSTVAHSLDLADSAVQNISTGDNNGTIKVDGVNVPVKGLGSAAFTNSTAYDAAGTAASEASAAESNAKLYADGLASNYATAAQGEKADSALQPSDVIDDVDTTTTNKPLSANMGKVLQDQIDNLKARGRFLALWNCATGLAQSNPQQSPYVYHAGDYFIVGTVASGSGTNYKPDGSSYTIGVASTTVETSPVDTDDVYYYDGTNWSLQINTQKTVSFGNVAGDPYDNSDLAAALNAKQDELTEGTGIDITNNTISNSGVRSVATGSTNGTISVNTNGTSADVAVRGLGSAAFTPTTNYATAAQGEKADTAVQPEDITNMQTTTNLVTSVSAQSTDAQYPSAKLFYDTIGTLESALNNINSGS